MTVERIEHVQLAMPAGGEDAAAAFYEGLLGLPRVPKPPHLEARGGCWFERGPAKVHLGVEADFRPARKAHPALTVTGLQALTASLRDAGVELADDEPLDGFERVYAYDPFGNRLELMEPVTCAPVSWGDFAAAEPEFARRVQALFDAHRHKTLATLRRDGSPRLSGIEVAFDDGELVLGMMRDSLKAADLRRDPRVAVHSQSEDPPEGAASAWPGDAKVAGVALVLPAREPDDDADADRFAVRVSEVVLTKVGDPPDHLVIESWHPGRGVTRHERR
jgi:catechol 2,3-dioxygenase-like lactoylglutathione lyase family enzyme